MKRLKSFIVLLCFFLLLTGFSSVVSDEENKETLSLSFNKFSIETEHDKEQTYSISFENDYEKGYEIRNIETNELLDRFTVSKEPDVNNMDSVSPQSSGYYIQEVNRDYVLTRFGISAIFRTTSNIEIYHYNSFRQINKFLGGDLRAISNGSWTMESPLVSAISLSGSYPTTKVQVSSSGVATIQYGDAISSGYSFSFLDYFGWNVSSSTSSSTYIRKYISNKYTINLYP